jgi:hypothetical protein
MEIRLATAHFYGVVNGVDLDTGVSGQVVDRILPYKISDSHPHHHESSQTQPPRRPPAFATNCPGYCTGFTIIK